MTPDTLDLARQLAAHPCFEWRRRMHFTDDEGCERGTVVVGGWYEEDPVTDSYGFQRGPVPAGYVPDLDDAATAGVLLAPLFALLPTAEVFRADDGIFVVWDRARVAQHNVGEGPTLGHAVARALLACWGPA